MTNPTESRERTLLPAAVWFVPAGMLLLALANLPYDFYALLRVVVCGTALLVVLHEYKLRGEPSGWMVVLVGVALLFNPLFPVGLLRKQWALIDASAAILLAFHYLACKRLATTTPDAPAARARSLRRKRVTVPTPHPGRLATPARPHAVKMPVSAKDWQLLREALEKHVRAPLKTWPEVGADWKKRKEYPREYAQRGRIATNSGLLTVLSYTLLYGCMHFDALCVLMRRQEFRVPLSLALAGSGDPAVLHVDFGCGPGTASWAVVNVLSDEARITTVGHDHNRHIIRLARKMTAHLARGAARGLGLSFHYDWTGFEREVVSLSERRWSAVIVTANSLFGQVPPSAVAPIVALITEISERTGEVPLFVAGTHPHTLKSRFETPGDESRVFQDPI